MEKMLKGVIVASVMFFTSQAVADSEPATKQLPQGKYQTATVRLGERECGDSCGYEFFDSIGSRNYAWCTEGDMQQGSVMHMCLSLFGGIGQNQIVPNMRGKIATLTLLLIDSDSFRVDRNHFRIVGGMMPEQDTPLSRLQQPLLPDKTLVASTTNSTPRLPENSNGTWTACGSTRMQNYILQFGINHQIASYGDSFDAACRSHDQCYGKVGTIITRKHCDEKLGADAEEICSRIADTFLKYECLQLKNEMVAVVRRKGKRPFCGARKIDCESDNRYVSVGQQVIRKAAKLICDATKIGCPIQPDLSYLAD